MLALPYVILRGFWRGTHRPCLSILIVFLFSPYVDAAAPSCSPESQMLVAKVQPDGRRPLYLLFGDLPAQACTAICGLLIGVGLMRGVKKIGNSVPNR